MRQAIAVVMIACAVLVPSTGWAQERLNRMAVGMNPLYGWAGTMGLSASRDVYTVAPQRLLLRADATVLSGERRSASGSAITLDAVARVPAFGQTIYGLAGSGVSPGPQVAIAYGGGIDFNLRQRPMFIEVRAYRQPEFGLMKLGVRF